MVLFGFLNGYLLAVVGADAGEASLAERVAAAAAALDPARHPVMTSVAALQADYGSEAHFERMLTMVLDGLRLRSQRDDA